MRLRGHARHHSHRLTPRSADVWVFHAGTKATPEGKILTNGGRVLAVTAVAPTLKEAQALAYKGVDCVHFEGKTFRRDIAYKCVAAESESGVEW